MSLSSLFAYVAAFAVFGSSAMADDRFIVDRTGDAGARAVVFIPGLASSGEVWSGAVAALEGRADAHVVTLSGFAGQPPAEPITPFITQAADALADYLVAEGLEDAVIVGHSLGGQIALQVAARAPDSVGHVLVVDSAPFYAGLVNPAATPEQAEAFAASMSAQMAAASREQFLAGLSQGLPVQSLDPGHRETIRSWGVASDQTTVSMAFGEVAGGDFRPGLDQVEAPVLVLAAWSAGAPMDADALRAVYEAQYERLRGSEIRVVEGSRHFIMYDQADVFADILRDVVGE